jgi:hypothetical protein
LRFTVHRPPIGEVSTCCHRPSGGDVACSVHVGVAPTGSAGFTLEDRLTLAVSGRDMLPWAGDRVGDVRERDVPAARPIPGNPVGLDTLGYRPRQAESQPSDLGHPDPTEVVVQPFDVMPFHTDLAQTLRALQLYATPGGDVCRRRSSTWPARNPAAPAAAPSDSRREATRTRREPRSTVRTAQHSREPCGPAASAVAAPPPNSTPTAHPDSAPPVLPPAQGSATDETATYPHRNHQHRQTRP